MAHGRTEVEDGAHVTVWLPTARETVACIVQDTFATLVPCAQGDHSKCTNDFGQSAHGWVMRIQAKHEHVLWVRGWEGAHVDAFKVAIALS